ncbi:MAG: hypothetical protein IPO21_13220 [Bacteroidales bacterium]|nr:hypothetical protein [Bacteroidales bacterium]
MKRTLLLIAMSFMFIGLSYGQKKNSTEVLYFKTPLPCCKARSCNMLQSDIDSIVVKYFSDEKIQFKVVMINDEANKALVEKYKAQSQSVVMVQIKRKRNSNRSYANSSCIQNKL